MKFLNNIKAFWQREQTKIAYQELKKIAKEDPIKFPWWVMTVASPVSSFIDHPIIGSKVLNELGLHELRLKWAAKFAEQRRGKLAQFLTPEEIAEFQKNGFICKENFLPEEQFKNLKYEVLNKPLPTRETLQGDTVTRRMALDYRNLDKMPETAKLLASPVWKNLINYVGSFKIEPMYYVQVILSHVCDARADPQTALHSDTFHSSMKAWLFLTDVAEDEGPFVYVAGSHILNEKRLLWERKRALNIARLDKMSRRGSLRILEKELGALGYGKPQKFAVKANTLIIADTYGFHARGESVRPSTRIEIWAFARRNPFLPWLGFNPVTIPFVKDRVIPIYWKYLDYLENKDIKNNPWKEAGLRLPTDPTNLISKRK